MGKKRSRTRQGTLRPGRRVFRAVVAALLLFGATVAGGCKDAHEIESVGFVLGLGIDETVDRRIEVWVQVALPSAKPQEADKQESWTAKAVGKTVWEAVRELNSRSAKVLMRAHVRTLVFGERFARGGVSRALDVLARDGQFRYKSWVLVTPDPIGDVLSAKTEQSSLAALFIDDIMRNTARSSTAPRSRFLDLLTAIEQPGDQPLLARVYLAEPEEGGGQPGDEPGNDEKTPREAPGLGVGRGEGEGGEEGGGGKAEQRELRIEGSAAFRGDKMVGWLDGDDTAMALLICNKLAGYSFVMPMPGSEGGTVGLDVIRSRTHTLFPEGVRSSPSALGATHVKLRITGTVDVREVLSEQQLMSMRSLEELETGISQYFEAGVRRLIDAAQNRLGCDVISIGECVRRRIPARAWERDMAPVWHDVFRQTSIVPDVHIEVGKRGMTMQSPEPTE